MGNKKSSKTTAPPANSKSQSVYFDYKLTLDDNIPYQRDSDTCNPRYLAEHGTRIIHTYHYDTKPFKIGNSSDSEENKETKSE